MLFGVVIDKLLGTRGIPSSECVGSTLALPGSQLPADTRPGKQKIVIAQVVGSVLPKWET